MAVTRNATYHIHEERVVLNMNSVGDEFQVEVKIGEYTFVSALSDGGTATELFTDVLEDISGGSWRGVQLFLEDIYDKEILRIFHDSSSGYGVSLSSGTGPYFYPTLSQAIDSVLVDRAIEDLSPY